MYQLYFFYYQFLLNDALPHAVTESLYTDKVSRKFPEPVLPSGMVPDISLHNNLYQFNSNYHAKNDSKFK